jgi:hypothetical protein
LLGVYDFIEQNKTATASVTDGHCFAVRLTDNKFESVDNEGRVCNLKKILRASRFCPKILTNFGHKSIYRFYFKIKKTNKNIKN